MSKGPRRKDKEILDPQMIQGILGKGTLCHLARVEDGKPYQVTMNYGYLDQVLYFHSALEGKKIEIIHSNPEVSFQVITDSKLVTGQNACEDWTMKYRSVVGNGYASIIEDPEEKIRALSVLMDQHSSRGPFEFSAESLQQTVVIKVEIRQMTAKQSGY